MVSGGPYGCAPAPCSANEDNLNKAKLRGIFLALLVLLAPFLQCLFLVGLYLLFRCFLTEGGGLDRNKFLIAETLSVLAWSFWPFLQAPAVLGLSARLLQLSRQSMHRSVLRAQVAALGHPLGTDRLAVGFAAGNPTSHDKVSKYMRLF